MSHAHRAALVAVALAMLGAGPRRAAGAPASQPASQPAAAAAAAPAPAAAVAAPAPAAAAPKSLAVAADKGWFVPGILVQAWFQLDRYTGNEAAAGKDYTASTFRLRRVEISAKGEILKGRFGYGVMIDPAKILEPLSKSYDVKDSTGATTGTVTVPTAPKAINALQDVWVSLLTDYADVAIGQFKIPVSWEALAPSSALLFPERSLVTLQWGDKRDLGLKVTKTFKYVGYYLGLFNGQGANNWDTNNSKDLAGRLEAYPIRGLTVAGMVYHELKESSTVYRKRRYEADLRFERSGFLFQGEFIRGEDQAPTDKAAKKGQGFYSTLAYVFLGGRLQPAVRIGLLDPDLSKGKDYTMFYEAGVSWYLYKTYAKLQLAYGRFQLTDESGKKSTNEVILAAQGHY